MLQNSKASQSQVAEMGVGVNPDEILNLVDHIETNYGQNRLAGEGAEDKILKGIPVFPGAAEGYAVVIQTIDDLRRIKPDSILICPRMSPDYTIAFQTVRGIVSEQGGITSTAASVARENGLPAVTGVQSARHMISDGDLVELDGTKGVVQINAKAVDFRATKLI